MRYIYIFLALLLSLSILPSQAARFGGNIGLSDNDYDSDEGDSADSSAYDVGLVFDTGKPGRVFAYRLNLNYIDGEIDDSRLGTIDLKGIYINNSFTFAIRENETRRIWLGPNVYFADIDYELNGDDEDGVAFGYGIVAGIDFMHASDVSFGLEAGLRKGIHLIDSGNSPEFNFEDYEYDGRELYVKLNVFF